MFIQLQSNHLNSGINSMQFNAPQPTNEISCTIFIFVNSGSGGGLGGQLLELQMSKVTFQIPIENQKDIRLIEVHFINMRQNKQRGFGQLKMLNYHRKKTLAIVCGGDGTVTWVLGEFVNHGIDPAFTPIGVIPVGTGNDFSRCLNWGAQKTVLIQNKFRSLKKLIRKWLHAKQAQFDVWDITAEIFPNGKFQKVSQKQSVNLQTNIYTRSFVNYFSFGIDGKIGYSFDSHRAKSRLGNMVVYGTLGVVKQVTKTKTIQQLLQSCYLMGEKMPQVCLFKTRLGKQKQQENFQYIQPGLKNILALNIDSYTGGVSGIWRSAKQILRSQVQFSPQCSYSDGKLQFISFQSGIGIAMQRSFGGFAHKIVQHSGPIVFNFRPYPNQPKHRTYLQIDGQFIRFTHPKRIIVQKSRLFHNGKIKVIVNDPQYIPYNPE